MKNKITIYGSILLLAITASCSKDKFKELNTDPEAILNPLPEHELASGLLAIHNRRSERSNDLYLGIYYWSQTFSLGSGNTAESYQATSGIGERWNMFYDGVGNRLVDVKELIKKLPEDKQAAYVQLNALIDIPLAYFAWYTADVYGSIAYTEAFRARYTFPPALTPRYETQEALYELLDQQLKTAVNTLKTPPSVKQVNLEGFDIYYDGDAQRWIKAANSLRLKMAMRLMKRNPEKLRAVATEVLGDEVGVIENDRESWKFIGRLGFTNAEDNPAGRRPVSGAKNLVDFMWNTGDPRLRIYFEPSHFTKERFEQAQVQGKIPKSFVWDGQLYRGQYISPDEALNTAEDEKKAAYFTAIKYKDGDVEVTGNLPSSIRGSFFNCAPNQGLMTFPVISCSDMLFMRAELAQRNIYGNSAAAEELYYRGIDSALAETDRAAGRAKINDYQPLTAEEVIAYKAKSGIRYREENALEQICVQQYINYFKNNNEAWALIKRTGYPAVDGKILKTERFMNGGSEMAMPRRFPIKLPLVTDLNAKNINAAIADMEKIAGFGTVNDITGRVWLDRL
ncbi:hypothetical protein BWD42_07515 [Sphingobacterium sp. CZ-UAM]|uniref:SusD/RagB family nutrient-binding outer membrane lipoprotein n=1 Tax=Sphingobacterium sp. CZ-UAM TaxID=1933868 RepID=UPI000985AFAB|nr:SusD/RagB family nutrient-binding outer membrane lipoprotein [Sphingobacterium sp. CZ-UAM]OOG19741.1 hypothetical protein BWD42_07515 [Sphingobacterium sp. CZ-UAM]